MGPKFVPEHGAKALDETQGGQDLDDLVVGDVGDGGRIRAAPAAAEFYERGLVQADSCRGVQAAPVSGKQCPAVGLDRVIDGVPLAGELIGDIGDRAASADLNGRNGSSEGSSWPRCDDRHWSSSPPHSRVAGRSTGVYARPDASAGRRRAGRQSALSGAL